MSLDGFFLCCLFFHPAQARFFPLYKTLGISDSQTDAVSSKLPGETVRESLSLKAVLQAKLDQTRRVSQEVAETAIVYAPPF